MIKLLSQERDNLVFLSKNPAKPVMNCELDLNFGALIKKRFQRLLGF